MDVQTFFHARIGNCGCVRQPVSPNGHKKHIEGVSASGSNEPHSTGCEIRSEGLQVWPVILSLIPRTSLRSARNKKEAKQRAAAMAIEAIFDVNPKADFMKTARGGAPRRHVSVRPLLGLFVPQNSPVG